MSKKKKDIVNSIVFGGILFGLFLFCLVKPDTKLSLSERRKLKQMPALTLETVFEKKGGSSFMDEFELYAKDQFPMRDQFRQVNALAGRYILGRKELNDLYVADGYIAKIEAEIHEKDIEWMAGRISYIVENYLGEDTKANDGGGSQTPSEAAIDNEEKTRKNAKVMLALIPDKNYYLAREKGYPYLDPEAVGNLLAEKLPAQVEQISLTNLLSKEAYYRTDTHWRQEAIPDVAAYILSELGRGDNSFRNYVVKELDDPFYGVYYGQAALPVKGENLSYLTWDGMEDITVNCYDTGKAVLMDLYDLDKAKGLDPYEVFLSGSKALITLDNPCAKDGELVVFRDSFGSSLAPLLTAGYRKITLVDIRYISPAMLGRFVDFDHADVLFLYSTMIINHSVGQILK